MNIKSSILFFLISPMMLFSQVTFSEPLVIREATNCRPEQSDLADIDQDGDLDVVVRSSRGPGLIWIENVDGEGLFDGYKTIEDSHDFWQIEVADLDADGAPDVLANWQGGLVWFRNDGSEGETWVGTTIVRPCNDFTTADMDGDGDIDIVRYYEDYESAFSWLPNLGLGEFGDPINIPLTINNIRQLTTGDMDADNDIDILISDDLGIRWIANNDALGNFTSIHSVSVDQWGYFMNTADLNGDGFIDILVSNYEGTSWMASQDSGASFGAAVEIADGGTSCISIDYDLDGDLDVVVADRFLGIFENVDGLGSFQAHGDTVFSSNLATPSLNVGDVDGDGDPDLLHSGRTDVGGPGGMSPPDKINWYENTDSWDPVRRSVAFIADEVMLEDLDGNGTPEAIMTSDNFVSWCADISPSTPAEVHEINISSQSSYWNSLNPLFNDLDDDGDMDMLYFYWQGFWGRSNPSWLFNQDGNGSFGNANYLEDTFGPMEMGDMDGDGDVDMVAIQKDPLRIVWIEHTDQPELFSTSHLVAPIEFELFEEYIRFTTADVDADGDLDIVSHGEHQDGVGPDLIWYENLDGMGTFSDPPDPHAIIDSVSFNTCRFGDVNGDSAIDILVQRHSSYCLLLNSGSSGIFEPLVTFPNTEGLADFVDLDNDGDLDIIQNVYLEASESRGIAWMENLDGQSAFSQSSIIVSGVDLGWRQAAVGDLDDDGLNDILGIAEGSCVWLKGQNVTNIDEDSRVIPSSLALHQNYPNPFNPTTSIRYELPEQSKVRLTVYDIRGQEVMTLQEDENPQGSYEVQWNGLDRSGNIVSTGVYFARLEAGEYSQTIKMLMIK